MKYKIFTAVNDVLSFTKEELEKLLDEVYEDGYKSGLNAGRAGYSWISNTPPTAPIYLNNPPYNPYEVTCTDATKVPISLTTSITNGSNKK